MSLVSTGLVAAGLSLLPLAVLAGPVDLLSHRAAYRLSLAKAQPGSGMTAVNGAMVMEWQADCEGWISTQRLGFSAATAEGPGLVYDVRFSSWESRDDLRLRFNVRTFEGGKVTDAYQGSASLDQPGGGGRVEYTEPKDAQELDLPAGTLFPTAHVRHLIQVAEAGIKVASNDVFDGSGPDGLTKVTAIIGAERRVSSGSGALERRWPVSLAYHSEEDSEDAAPEFELSFELSERGVLHDVMLDYGDFTLKGELEKLEELPAPTCN